MMNTRHHFWARPFLPATLLALIAMGLSGSTIVPVPLPDDPACTDMDRQFIRRTYELAASAGGKGNSTYGALLVKDGAVLMEFENDARTSGDVTHHAETGLLSFASREFGREGLAGTILYTSTEPCIMCCGSIRAAGISTFVYGTTAVQVTRLRGQTVPANPLECREVFTRTGRTEVVIRGPLLEAEGLAVHAARLPPAVGR